MNTEQLIAYLKQHPNTRVLQSKDSEGNEFSSVEEATVMYVEKDYDGGSTEEVWEESDLVDRYEGEDADILSNFEEVLVFWPV